MIEVGVKCVVDLGLPRKKAVVSVCLAGFLVGCFSCWSLVNIDNQDWVWGIGLLVSGAFIAILAWKYGVEKLRTQEVNATVLLQFGVVILAGLALSKFFNTKTVKGAMKDNEAGK